MCKQELIEFPLRLIVREVGTDAAGLCCPLCGMDYVHPEQVAVHVEVVGQELVGVRARDVLAPLLHHPVVRHRS